MTLLEVAKHVLEAMEDAMYRADTHEFYDAKESLRYAIEQAEQEPVGQLQEEAYGRGQVLWFKKPADQSMLYTAPTPRKPLTDEEIALISGECAASAHRHDDFSFARAVIAAYEKKQGEQT